jgi:hypothetical protein
MGSLIGQNGHLKCVYHTYKNYINIFINLILQLTKIYDNYIITTMAANRIVICDRCGREIEMRSDFAHITLYNHYKSCK